LKKHLEVMLCDFPTGSSCSSMTDGTTWITTTDLTRPLGRKHKNLKIIIEHMEP